MLEDTLIDLKIAFKLYYDYKKEYFLTFVLFLIGIFILVAFAFFLIFNLLPDSNYQLDGLTSLIIAPFMLIILCCLFLILLAYARTTYGLTYDIITSGELFTEFKRTIFYFKRFWIYFSLLSIPFVSIFFIDQLIGIFFIFRFINTNEDIPVFLIPIKIFVYIFDFLMYVLFIEIMPSLIIVKKLHQSIKENFQILRRNFSRILLSIGLYYVIFRGPMFIIDMSRLLLVSNIEMMLGFNLMFLIVTFVNGVMGFPILSLISTRIYNTTKMNQQIESANVKTIH